MEHQGSFFCVICQGTVGWCLTLLFSEACAVSCRQGMLSLNLALPFVCQKGKLKQNGYKMQASRTWLQTMVQRMAILSCFPRWPRPRLQLCSDGWTLTPAPGGRRTSSPSVMSETFLEWLTLEYVILLVSCPRLAFCPPCLIRIYMQFSGVIFKNSGGGELQLE